MMQNMMGHQTRMSQSGKTGAMVYGIVMYDFKAERPDELDAKEGEAIIVIAQSNPEWFVAKPITRLGGPGLIPVSFIEIRDMTTGQAVPDAQQAVAAAGVPKVEEWKKMAADYKNGSIPLGKLQDNTQQSLQAGMERMSLGGRSQTQGRNGSVSRCIPLDSHIPDKPTDIPFTLWLSCYARRPGSAPCTDQGLRAALLFRRRHLLVYH
jgi:bud emergence protein 1